jgi:precorrin-2 dehydrogenase / sirohydrochlorin ferrochelatase
MPVKMKLPQYPVFLDLRRRPVIVIGGGEVAERLIRTLMACGAKVRIISPEVSPGLEKLAREGKIRLRKRAYRIGDLMGYPFVFAATNDPKVNLMVHDEVQIRSNWVHVVDEPDLCTFFAPEVLSRGNLAIAVSTAGISPILAKHIRDELEKRYGPEHDGFLDLLEELRPVVNKRFPRDPKSRAKALAALAEANLLKHFKAGKPGDARKEALRILERMQ